MLRGDAETGLDYAFGRFYNSRLGRFMSPDSDNAGADPSNPQSWNMYSYVMNNPLRFTDPTGMDPCQEDREECDTNGTGFNPENGGIVCSNGDCTRATQSVTVSGDDGCQMSESTCQMGFQQMMQGQELEQPQSQGSQSRLTCAANYGQNHSIAAVFGAQNSFVGNLFGGNTFSNLAYLGQSVFGSRTPTGGDIAGTILGGAGQGLPGDGPGFKGAAGQASDAIVGGAISAGYNSITGVGGQTLELGITASGTVATVATPLAATTVGTIVGYANLAKLALDAGTFAYGAIFACH